MLALREEFNRVKQRQFRLDFDYPDEETKKALRIVNRDLTRTERKRLDAKVNDLTSAIEALENGDVRVEDLPEALRRRLKEIFGQ